MARKYQSYIIEVEFHNGDKEKIDMFNSKEVNHENYTEMRNVYKEIKEQYKDKNCNINFYGSSDDSCLDIMFTKVIKNNEESDEPLKNSIKIIEEMESLLGQLKLRSKSLGCYVGAIEKKQDVIHHQAEASLNKPISDEEKIKAFDKLALIEKERRQLKNEQKIIEVLIKNNIFGILGETLNQINQEKVNIYNLQENGAKKYIDGLENEKVIREIKYNSFKQRINLMKDMQKKYDKVAYDDEKMILICYNKCMK